MMRRAEAVKVLQETRPRRMDLVIKQRADRWAYGMEWPGQTAASLADMLSVYARSVDYYSKRSVARVDGVVVRPLRVSPYCRLFAPDMYAGDDGALEPEAELGDWDT